MARLLRLMMMQDVRDAALDGFFHDVLDDRLVHDGQHFLGHGLGDGQKARAESGGGDDGFANGGGIEDRKVEFRKT